MPSIFDAYLQNSPTLKLLRSASAGFVLEFLQSSFKESGLAQVAEEELEADLDRALAAERMEDPALMPREARFYLNLWCEDSHRYLQKRFSEEHSSFVYQLTRHSEKALAWMEDLRRGDRRGYTTSESRFSRIVTELQRIDRETNADPEARRAELLQQRDAIDAEIKRLRETGRVDTLDEAAIRDSLNDLESMIEEFLGDFRAIEETFREQARDIQRLHLEQQLSKGDLVAHVLDADDALRSRDQGRSYFGFRQSIVSVENRERLQALANRAAELAAGHGVNPLVFENLLRRLYTEVTTVQGVYRRISSQLRRVVESHASRQTRYLMELLADVRGLAHRVANEPPQQALLDWEEPVRINNLMEVSFWEPAIRGDFGEIGTAAEMDPAELRAALARIGKPLALPVYRKRVADALAQRPQISLRELLELHPPSDGAVDLVAYLVVASEGPHHLFMPETIRVDLNRPLQPRYAELEHVIFMR